MMWVLLFWWQKEQIHLSKLIHALVVLPPPSQLKALACTYIKLVFCSFAPLWHPLGLCTFGSDLGVLSISLSSLSPLCWVLCLYKSLSGFHQYFLSTERVTYIQHIMGITKSPLYTVVSLLLANFHQILTYAKDFLMEKIIQICQISKASFFKSPNFYDKFK
jgi:hypothetical protein